MALHDVLVLNSNYEPLNVCNVRRAISLLVLGKADILVNRDHPIMTAGGELEYPSVVRMKYQVRRPLPQLRLSRHAVLARDQHMCQYCGSRSKEMTIDHVVPRWAGGPHTWDNLVACCRKCNLKKADKTPTQANMKLARKPRRPSFVPYLSLPIYLKAQSRDDWRDFLPYFPEVQAVSVA
jgi:5-methylcytosine-specific restriction endonuclease McrA